MAELLGWTLLGIYLFGLVSAMALVFVYGCWGARAIRIVMLVLLWPCWLVRTAIRDEF